MFGFNPLYKSDGYKPSHKFMLVKGTTKVYGTWIPRSLKRAPKGIEKVVSFGQQMVWKEIDEDFTYNFFNPHKFDIEKTIENGRPTVKIVNVRPGTKEDALKFAKDYSEYFGGQYDAQHFSDLWDLGYLPIKVKALPEGIETPAGIPHMTFVNTKDHFGWLTLYLETIVSNKAWKPSTSTKIQ